MSDAELQRLRRIAISEPTPENLARLGMAYLRSTTPRRSLTLVGRRWFQKSYGNTYHSVDVYVDDAFIGCTGIHYGYGDQWEQTGWEFALDNSDLPPRVEGEPLWRWAERLDIDLERSVTDVRRKRDLASWVAENS